MSSITEAIERARQAQEVHLDALAQDAIKTPHQLNLPIYTTKEENADNGGKGS